MSNHQIVIVGQTTGWHATSLTHALRKRGHCVTVVPWLHLSTDIGLPNASSEDFGPSVVNDAELTGSVNTILLDNDKIVGENTDVFGLQAAYLKEIDSSIHKSALIIGAGGVSPSVILSLQKSGIKEISITNRTNEKCIFLKKKFNYLNILPWSSLEDEIKNFDIIINATSLGLKEGDDFNFKFSNTKNNLIYIDTIYNPLETKTYRYLKEDGRKVFNGLDMFIYQGQKSFYLWNKINPEIDNGVIELLNSKLR